MSWIWLFIVIDVHRKRSRSVVYQVGFIAWSLIPLFALIPIVERIDLVDEIQVYQEVTEPYAPSGYETMGDASGDIFRQTSMQTDATRITLFSINTFVFLAILVSNAIAIRKLRKVRTAVRGPSEMNRERRSGGSSFRRSRGRRSGDRYSGESTFRGGYAAKVTPFIRIMSMQVAAFFIYDVGLFCNIFSLEMRDARFGAQHAVGIVMATTMQQTMALVLSILQLLVVSRAKTGRETKSARGPSQFDLRMTSDTSSEMAATPGGSRTCRVTNESTSISRQSVRTAGGAVSKPAGTTEDSTGERRSGQGRVGSAVAFREPTSCSQV